MAELLSSEDAIDRFKENENRIDIFVNDPNEIGYYSTNEKIPRQVESIPRLVERLDQEAGLILTQVETIRDQVVEVGSLSILKNLYCVGDSWTYIDTINPLNSFTKAALSSFSAAFGANTWNVINCGIGGTTISEIEGGKPSMVSRIPLDVVKYLDASLVQLQGGINDINLGATDSQIISAIESEIATITAAGFHFVICTIGPFKGASSYNATTRGYVDNVNNWIRSNYSATNQVIDLWELFNDPSNDGAFLPAYRFDDFHPNNDGKIAWANLLANNPYIISANATPLNTSSTDKTMRDMQRSKTVVFKGMVIGKDDGLVRPLTIRSPDILTDQEQIYIAQNNSLSSGFMVHADSSGNLTFKRLAESVSLVTRFLIAATNLAFSKIFTKLHIISEGVVLRMSQTVYGEGVGSSMDFGIIDAKTTYFSTYSKGGSAFSDFLINARTITITSNGSTRMIIEPSGAIALPTMPYYANNALAVAALGVGRLYRNTTIGAIDITF